MDPYSSAFRLPCITVPVSHALVYQEITEFRASVERSKTRKGVASSVSGTHPDTVVLDTRNKTI